MKRKIIVLLIFVLAAVLAFSCVMIFREVSQSEKEKDDFEKLGEIIVEEIPSEIIKEDENGNKQVLEVFAEAIQSLPDTAVAESWKVTLDNERNITAVP